MHFGTICGIPKKFLLVISVVWFVYGCQKRNFSTDMGPSDNVQRAKAAFVISGHDAELRTRLDDSLSLYWEPSWNSSSQRMVADSSILVYVPLKLKLLKYGSPFGKEPGTDSTRKYLVVEMNGRNRTFDIVAYLFEGKEESLDKFTGQMFIKDLSTNRSLRYSFNSGVRQSSKIAMRQLEEACLYYNQCVWVAMCNGEAQVFYTRGTGHDNRVYDCGIPYLPQCPNAKWYSSMSNFEVFCENDEIPPLPPPPVPPSAPPGPYPGTLGSGGGGDYEIDTIITDASVNDPCIQTALSKVLAHRNNITAMFNMMFGGGGDYMVRFLQANLSPTVTGDTYIANQYSFEISLNNLVLLHSSQELIASTAIHEMLHAIFDARKFATNDPLTWSQAFQHNIMVSKYLDNMSEMLQSIFPGLSWADAQALSWEGLQDTLGWQALTATERNNIALLGDQFDKNHTKGNRCP